MTNARLFLAAVVMLQPLAALQADGGTLRFSERHGGYSITVFTAPTPLRAGPVDVSVFVQDAVTGESVIGAQITVQARLRDHPEATIHQRATTNAATNKLFQAAVFDLPEAGWWDVAIVVEGLRQPLAVHFEMEADEPLPRVWEMIPWIVWPVVVVFLFFVHKWLMGRKVIGLERINKASSSEEEPALATLSPNQRNTN